MIKYTVSELVEKCIANNASAQRYVFDKYSPKLLGIVSRYFNESEDAEDVLIEAFHLILTKIHTYSGNESEAVFFSWMKRICINRALLKIRDDKRRNKEEQIVDEYKFIACDINSFDILTEKERTKQMLMFIHELPRQQRIVFNLYAIEGYSHKEIAQELGLSESTSKTNYLRAKQKLKIRLTESKYYDEIESN